ncbi:MAG: type I DNA topoisomerase [Acidobacteria bacterium]|nr:type I DNA topoisomerase [Acidobacteriota bacterium]MDW7983972.1 type I DNA topoisomerase [Acidobacteriota bacterium]
MALAKTLVIVESPAKARTLARYLGSGYVVRASKGHVKDLPKNTLGVRVEEGFEPQWVVVEGRGPVLKELKEAARAVDRILLATDPDREGEAISYHIAEELKPLGKPIARVWLREITQRGVRESLKELRDIDQNLVEAQFARRILDRLVGYQISPLLWDKVWRGLSAGRVQSVALRLIVEREREIERFVPQEYWTVRALVQPEGRPAFWVRLVRQAGRKIQLPDEASARAAEQVLRKAKYVVLRVEKKRKHRTPPPPFITAKLQQAAAQRWRWPALKTMTIAQRLYEGVDLPQGRMGLITYMRTDSVRISEEAIQAARAFIREHFDARDLPATPRRFKAKADAQDAHEAIRPTHVDLTPDTVRPHLSPDEARLYELVWQRFVASQMADAEVDVTTVTVQAGDYELEARGEVLVYPGYLRLYQEELPEAEEPEADAERLPPLKEDEVLALQDLEIKQNFTQPPPRYTEATLIRELERRGIGRPSTYATIVSIIQNRDYVMKDRQFFRPTALGRLVCDLLERFFPDMMDYDYTARVEASLDEVEQGKKRRQEILQAFYQVLLRQIRKARKDMPSYKQGVEQATSCPACGEGRLILRWSRNGGFFHCSRQTEGCTYKADYEAALMTPTSEVGTREAPTDAATASRVAPPCPRCGRPMTLRPSFAGTLRRRNLGTLGNRRIGEWKCPVCQIRAVHGTSWPAIRTDRTCAAGHAPIVLRSGPYGYYYRCTEPDCKATAPLYADVPCLADGCPGEMVARFVRRGNASSAQHRRLFYGCNRYPACSFTFSGTIVRKACPVCGAPYQVQLGRQTVCARPTCTRSARKASDATTAFERSPQSATPKPK